MLGTGPSMTEESDCLKVVNRLSPSLQKLSERLLKLLQGFYTLF